MENLCSTLYECNVTDAYQHSCDDGLCWISSCLTAGQKPGPCPRFGSEQLGTQCLLCSYPSLLFCCLGLHYVAFSGKSTHFTVIWELWKTHFIINHICVLKSSRIGSNILSTCFISRWLVRTLAVRFFKTALNADLKIKSIGLFSVQGVSIQFYPQHTLVRQTVFDRRTCQFQGQQQTSSCSSFYSTVPF